MIDLSLTWRGCVLAPEQAFLNDLVVLRDGGFRPIPGSEIQFANGVEKSADERYLFLNGYFDDVVKKVDVRAAEVAGAADVSSPDNLAWSPGGAAGSFACGVSARRAVLSGAGGGELRLPVSDCRYRSRDHELARGARSCGSADGWRDGGFAPRRVGGERERCNDERLDTRYRQQTGSGRR